VQRREDKRDRLLVFDQFLGVRVVDGRSVAHYAQGFESVSTFALLRGRQREQRGQLERSRRVLGDVPLGPLKKRVGQPGDGTEQELFVVAETAETIESPGYL
jgi:hypothetical protein